MSKEPMTKKPMAEERLAEIRAMEKAATQGPWWAKCEIIEADECGNTTAAMTYVSTNDKGICILYGRGHDDANAHEDAAFIAHAREDIPALLDEVERLRAENETLRAQVEGLKECVGVHVFTAMNPGADIGVARTKGKAQIDAIGVEAFLSVWKAACEDERNLPELKKMVMQFKD